VRLLLDSAFLIDLLEGLPAAIVRHARIFETGEEPVVNEIVVCEVRAGMHAEDVWMLSTILEPVEFIQPGPDSAYMAGQWRAEARRSGRGLSLADALIAAAAQATDAAVLTRNVRDFQLTPVRIETY
jgi:predicted nucleic acid-binding protein